MTRFAFRDSPTRNADQPGIERLGQEVIHSLVSDLPVGQVFRKERLRFQKPFHFRL